jgi:hypothetical protein
MDLKEVAKLLGEAGQVPKSLIEDTHQYFVDTTPIRTGRARQNTNLQNYTIEADYPYAERLDQGYSKQAPKGMTEPTIKYMEQRLDQLVGGIK